MNRTQVDALVAALPAIAPADGFAHAMALLNDGYADLLLPAARRLADRHPGNPRMAQMLGLAARAVGEGPLAYRAFHRAAALAPHDALIAHSHARAALEAGKPASGLFAIASRLAPADGSVLQGQAAALFAEHRGEEAIGLFSDLLAANPLWLEGHRTYAQLAAQSGGQFLTAIDRALASNPGHSDLHRLKLTILIEARCCELVPAAIAVARAALGRQAWLDFLAGHAASELGDHAEADRCFAFAPAPADAGEAGLLARHLIKARRPEPAIALLDRWLGQIGDEALWPYRALAWRIAEDPRAAWLEADPALVGVYDLADRIPDIPGLASHLRTLHIARAAPLDQSVRGGTQTDGNLLLRDEAPLQALRALLMETVAAHIARLPAARPGHPTLLAVRNPLRFAGSWSVRLTRSGFHTDHVHPQGWLSSALYLTLPTTLGQTTNGNPHAGWLALGECRALVPELAPTQLVEPRAGRLVLFPSTMWHGTRPFPAGERLTIAFDIARPKQD